MFEYKLISRIIDVGFHTRDKCIYEKSINHVKLFSVDKGQTLERVLRAPLSFFSRLNIREMK